MVVSFVLRIDDVVPGFPWEKFKPLEETILELGIRPVIGVVPDNQDASLNFEPLRADFFEQIRSWRRSGWTVAQHGYQHLYTSFGRDFLGRTRKSEFLGYSGPRQEEMLRKGKEVLEAEAVWDPVFMAPSHSFDETTLGALESLGFRFVTDGWGVHPYEVRGLRFVPQLFATPRTLGPGLYTICLHIGTMSRSDVLAASIAIRQRAGKFISFPDAAVLRSPRVLAPAVRAATRLALPAYWKVTAALRGAAPRQR